MKKHTSALALAFFISSCGGEPNSVIGEPSSVIVVDGKEYDSPLLLSDYKDSTTVLVNLDKHFATVAFMSYHAKVTVGYKKACDGVSVDITPYIEMVERMEQVPVDEATLFVQSNPNLKIKETVQQKNARIEEVAQNELSNQGVSLKEACTVINKNPRLIADQVKFSDKQPELYKILMRP